MPFGFSATFPYAHPTAGAGIPTGVPATLSNPTISGIQTVGQTLTGNHGAYTNFPNSYAYRWLKNAVAIGGATAQTHVIAAGEDGANITFEETPSNVAFGAGSAATSAAVVPAAVLAISGSPTTTGAVGAAYSFTPSTSGGHATYTYSLSGTIGASGLSFSTSTGALTATTLGAAATYGPYTITVTDNDGLTAALTAFSITTSAGIVTGITILGGLSIPITNPITISVPLQANGTVAKIVTTGTEAIANADWSKVTITVDDLGHNTAGAQVTHSRLINVRSGVYKPYNEIALYQPVLGEFHVKLGARIYNQDATWYSRNIVFHFAAGWLPGAAAETMSVITRQDTLAYRTFPARSPNGPWDRVASGGTFAFEVGAGNTYPSGLLTDNPSPGAPSMLACVEAWFVDSAATVGTVARASAYNRSPRTPANATLVGLPADTYQLAVDPAGLVQGRVGLRFTAKPWIGPPTNSFTVGDAFPTCNQAQELPMCYDVDASWEPLYGLINYDPAATNSPNWTRSIASNVNPATIDVSGLCRTQAGAEAAGVYYADYASMMIAVRRVNGNAGPFTILADNGVGTRSYARTTLHNDVASAVGVCPDTPSSVMGADLGCYSIRVACSNVGVHIPGLVAAELRSSTGLPSTACRWRGRDSAGTGVTASTQVPSRFRTRGIIADSTGVTTGAHNIVFDGGATGASVTAVSEANAVTHHAIDSRYYNTVSAATSTSTVTRRQGWIYLERTGIYNSQNVGDVFPGSAVFPGMVASIGSAFVKSATVALVTCEHGGVHLGLKMQNWAIQPPAWNAVKPLPKDILWHNVDIWISDTTENSSVPFSNNGAYDRSCAMMNVLCRNDTATGSQAGFKPLGDNSRFVQDNMIVWHVTTANKTSSAVDGGRTNWGYSEQGWTYIEKNLTGGYLVTRSINIKGGNMVAPEKASSDGDGAWVSTSRYHVGSIVTDSGNGYECVQDVPASSGILLSNTDYWYNGGTSTVSYNQQPLRRGNENNLYHTDILGCVAVRTANGDAAPSPTAWYGYVWAPGEKYGQTWTNYFNNIAADDYTPKTTGPLVNMVPSGQAVLPRDMVGNPFRNDGTDASGCLQVP